mmetsp:Transcript_54476/g.81105  ORF Transcript_54476/g.81105 Transcript_54476/m.81105 type:complete len:227 (+) Transcript_54476:2-682(+)
MSCGCGDGRRRRVWWLWWFSSFLGVRCWLARHYQKQMTDVISSAGTPLHVSSSVAAPVPTGKSSEEKAFANEAPMLLLSQDSIIALNSVLLSQGQRRVNPCHFRPNLVVGGMESLATASCVKGSDEVQTRTNPEDNWSSVTFKEKSLELSAVGQCARCSMVDIDPSSGMKGKTLRALADYRRKKGEIMFGVFYSGKSRNNQEELCSDDEVWIEEGDHLTCTQKAVS